MSDNFHHSEGTLAAREDAMSRLIDAFDYTRSEAAAVRGLRSVAGAGNVLPRLMQLDSSRHHQSALRRQMALPVCPRLGKGSRNRTFNTWITCTGAQDELSGDANMDDYSRKANGFLLGVDRSLTCNLRFGASLGYETSSSTSGSVEVDADSIFLDAYAVAVTGRFRHRASVGLASSAFDMKRCVAVEAGYHSFSGQSKSSADGLTLNFGYELSSDYQLNERSWLTRYLTANLSWHQLEAMKEKGLGAVGLETSYDDEWQADVALGVQYNREFAAMRYQEPATFYASAGLHLELLNEQVSAQSRFRGSSAGWEIKSMKRGRFYAEFGAGVMVPLSPAWTATAGAAVEVGAEHTGISGHVGVRYSF
jgi:outer membrane autotransporter protein